MTSKQRTFIGEVLSNISDFMLGNQSFEEMVGMIKYEIEQVSK